MHQPLAFRLLASTAAIAWIAALPASPAMGQSPQGASVAAGAAAVSRQGTTTVVTQGSDRAVVDWRSFSVGAGETVRFDQPGRSSVILNRVTGGEVSRLDGRISANGQVWLANPNGVLIGTSGRIDVAGLLATTGRVDSAEFLRSGQARIDQMAPDGLIRNDGAVRVADGGYAALAAAALRNDGVIVARAGSIALGAGSAVAVDFVGDRLLQFQVTQPLTQAPAGADALIGGAGLLAADGGVVRMSARAAKGVIDNVINLTGHVIASDVRIDGGTVTLGDGGAARVSARVDASSADGVGGRVELLGEKVGLMEGASIDASGATGGGTVLIGGDWQGKGSARNAQVAYVAPGAVIKADATQAGDGGKAVLWADDTTRFGGTISARGGVSGGAGGQVETSGKRVLSVDPAANVTTAARAAGAKAGSWLLDPTDITINTTGGGALTGAAPSFLFSPGVSSAISVSTIVAGLASGDVTIQTGAGAGNGDITFSAGAIAYSGVTARTLKLIADRDIIVNSGAKIDFSGGAHNVVLNAGAGASAQALVVGGIRVAGVIQTTGGSISLVGGQGGTLSAQGSSVTKHGVEIAGGVLDAGTGLIVLRGVGRPGDTSADVHGVYLSAGSLFAEGGVEITGAGGSAASASARGVYVVNTPITTVGGALKITGTASGSGSDRQGVRIDNNAGSTISFGAGGVAIDGTSAATGSSTRGVELYGGTIDGSGAILINGQGGGASGGNTTAGFYMQGGVYLKSTASGAAITVTGTRGLGNGRSANIAGGTMETTVGDLMVIGTSATGSGTDLTGVYVDNGAALITASGAITLTGTGGPGSGNDGVAILGSVKATGAGSITLIGDGSTGGIGVNFSSGTVSTASGDLTIRGDSFAASSSTVSSASGKIRVEPLSASDAVDLFGTATPGAGVAQMTPSFLGALSGDLVVGRGDLTGAINVAAGADLPANMLIKSGTGAVNFLGAIDAAASGAQSLAVETGGAVSFAGNVGAATKFSAFSVSAGLTKFDAVSVVTTGTQSIAGPVLLAGSPSFTTTNSAVIFSGAVNASTVGGQTVKASLGTGTLTLAGGAGATTRLSSLSVANADLGGVIVTQNQQSYGFARIAASATLSTIDAPIQFGSALNGPGDLTLKNGTGATSFVSAVGATTPLGSLTQLGTGAVRTTGSVKTTGSQSYAGPIQMVTSTTFSTTGGALLFDNTIDATALGFPAELGVAAGAGSVSFGDVVGGSFPVGTLKQTGTGAVFIDKAITSKNEQSYAGSLVLDAGASFTTTDNKNLTFTGPINAGKAGGAPPAFSVGTGTVSLVGGFGATKSFDSLSLSSAVALGGTIKTEGSQSYGGSVALLSATTMATNGADILFGGAVRGPGGLTVASGSGDVSLASTVGATTPLADLTINSAGTLTTGGNISTKGAQSYAGSVLLAAPTIFATTNKEISFNAGIDSKTAGALNDLTFSAGSASVSIGGALGGSTPLQTITQLGSGTLSLGGVAVSAGLQNYAGSVVLTSDASFSTSGANVIFQGSIDAAAAGGQSLVASLGGGTLNLLGGVGGGTALSSLAADGATVIGGGGVSTTGSQSYGGAVTLTADATLSSSGQAVAFGGAVDGGYAFTVSGTSVSFSGAVGGSTALTSLSVAASGSGGLALPAVNATAVSLNVGGGTVTQSGAIAAGSLELLATGASYSLTNADNAITVLAGDLTSLTLVNGPLASLTIGTAGATTGVTATGAVSITQTGAGQSIQLGQTLAAVGDVTLTSAATIAGPGLITGSALILSAVSGTLTVGGGVPIPGPIGTFIVNGAPLVTANPTPDPPPTAPPAQIPSVTQPVAPPAQPPTVAPLAPTPPVVTAGPPAAPAPVIPSTPPTPTPVPAPTGTADAQVIDQLNGILLANRPTDNRLDLTMNLNGGRGVGGFGGVQLGPRTPPVVAETGARLASAQTILLDAADAAGAGGQVVASNLDVLGGVGKRVILPGLLLTDPELARRGLFREDIRDLIVPEINEEPLLD